MKRPPQRLPRIWRGIAAALGLLSLVSCAEMGPVRPAGEAGQSSLLIRGVTVIPMDRPGSMTGQDVLIRGERITAMGRTGSIRAGNARVIDGRGKHLIPGLWDMHAHTTEGVGGNAADTSLPLYLSYGIVGVRDMGATLDSFQALRSALAQRSDLPEVVAAGPVLDGPPRPWQQSVALPLADTDAARAAVRDLAAAGVDFLKPYDSLTPEQYAAVAEAGAEAGLPLAGHVPMRMTVEQVSAAGQSSIEHAGLKLAADCVPDGLRAVPAMLNAWIQRGFAGRYGEALDWWGRQDVPGCHALHQRLAERRTWVTPTLTFEIKGGDWMRLYDLSGLSDEALASCQSTLKSINAAPADVREAYFRRILEQVRALHGAGVPLLAGSDVPNPCLAHGRSLHTELQLLREAGLSAWDVLRTATINPARFLGRSDEGAVREGMRANLLLLDADPLTDISNTLNIAGLVLRGKWDDATDLKRRRASRGAD